QQCQAAQEAEGTAAPAGDQSGLLADGAYPEEALSHFEHQCADRLGLAVGHRGRPGPVSLRRHRPFPFGPYCPVDILVVNSHDDTLIVFMSDLCRAMSETPDHANTLVRPPIALLLALLAGL